MTIFERYQSFSWTPKGGATLVFPVESTREGYRNRLVRHKRPYRDGARLDDTGHDAIVWTLSCGFYNGNWHEAEIADPAAVYPQLVNDLCDSFKIHETGDLVTATRGTRRCRAESYDRTEASSPRDAAIVNFVWVEDNEDDAAAAAQQGPSVAAVTLSKARAATFDVESTGLGGDGFASLTALAAEVEALVRSPGEYAGELEGKANALTSRVRSIERAFASESEQATSDVRRILTDPMNSRAGRRLREVSDLAQQSVASKLSMGPRIVGKVSPRDTSLFAMAAASGADVADVLRLNPGLNAFFVPAGTLVRVRAA